MGFHGKSGFGHEVGWDIPFSQVMLLHRSETEYRMDVLKSGFYWKEAFVVAETLKRQVGKVPEFARYLSANDVIITAMGRNGDRAQ